MVRRTIVATAVAIAAAVCVSACSGSSSGTQTPTATSSAPTTSTAPTTTTAPTTSSTPTGSSADPVSIPIQLATGQRGRHVPLVTISVGSGPAVKVVLDTGSAGLLLAAQDIGSKAVPTGMHLTRSYVGFSLTANVVSSTVSLIGTGQRYSSATMHVGAVTSALTSYQRSVGAVGILGIAAGDAGTTQPPLLSPLAELPAPLSSGYLIDAAAGTLQLGASTASGAIRVPLTRAGWTYPNGLPGYVKPVSAQWTIGSFRGALPTTFDTGGGDGFVARSLLPAAYQGRSQLPRGTPVAVTLGGHEVVSFTVGGAGSPDPGVNPSQHVANVGEYAFEHARIGVDLARGALVIIPR